MALYWCSTAARPPTWPWRPVSRPCSACRLRCNEDDDSPAWIPESRRPCGLVMRGGPVPQGVINPTESVARPSCVRSGPLGGAGPTDPAGRLKAAGPADRSPPPCGSLESPLRSDGQPGLACIQRQHRKLAASSPAADPLFLTPRRHTRSAGGHGDSPLWPVFLQRAAYWENRALPFQPQPSKQHGPLRPASGGR